LDHEDILHAHVLPIRQQAAAAAGSCLSGRVARRAVFRCYFRGSPIRQAQGGLRSPHFTASRCSAWGRQGKPQREAEHGVEQRWSEEGASWVPEFRRREVRCRSGMIPASLRRGPSRHPKAPAGTLWCRMHSARVA